MVRGWQVRVKWIPRAENTTCDQLAKDAVANKTTVLSVYGNYGNRLRASLYDIVSEFARRFQFMP